MPSLEEPADGFSWAVFAVAPLLALSLPLNGPPLPLPPVPDLALDRHACGKCPSLSHLLQRAVALCLQVSLSCLVLLHTEHGFR